MSKYSFDKDREYFQTLIDSNGNLKKSYMLTTAIEYANLLIYCIRTQGCDWFGFEKNEIDFIELVNTCDFTVEEKNIFEKLIVVYTLFDKSHYIFDVEIDEVILYVGKLFCEYENGKKNKFCELSKSEKKIIKKYMGFFKMRTVVALKNAYISSLIYSLHNNYKPDSTGYTLAKKEFETLAKKQKEEKQAEQEKQGDHDESSDKEKIN
jgi:hypothetical protein